MKLVSYIFKKALYGCTVLLGVIVIVFFLFNILPGDAARMTLGQRADIASLEAVKKEFGLDKSKPEQFLLFISDLSPISILEEDSFNKEKYNYTKLLGVGHGKALVIKAPYLRRSYQSKKKVSEILSETIPNSGILALSSILFVIVVGIPLGVIAAQKKDSWVDKTIIGTSVLGISLPSFFAGILIAWFFGFVLSDYLHLNISGSLTDYDPFSGKIIVWKNLILPSLTLGIRPLAVVVQLTRSSMLNVLKQDYIRTAKAKGLSNFKVVYKHALRNALNPVITAISGWFASIMAGAFFVEYIFGWNGLGKATVDALEFSDFPVVMGSVIFVASFFVLINILVDVLYALLDPRIKL